MPVFCRFARPQDAASLMRFYQAVARPTSEEPLFLDERELQGDISRPDRRWALAARGEEPTALVSMALEPENGLGKIHRMYAAGAPGERRENLVAVLGFLMGEIRIRNSAEVVYSTTRTISVEDQQATLDAGFHILGVFPSAVSADERRVNGLSVWHAPGVLDRRRAARFFLHPALAPFYGLAARACALPALPEAGRPALPRAPALMPRLELIEAPFFSSARFHKLRSRQQLSVNFYPYQSPNTMVVSPEQDVEVFVSVDRERRFAAVLGEHLTASIDAVSLYREIAGLLHKRHISYIEAINDASDVLGIECLLAAGFSPCGYFPALKAGASFRRDFVVLARSFEFMDEDWSQVPAAYGEFLREYFKARVYRRTHEDTFSAAV